VFDFFFKKKKKERFDFSALGIDMHSHLIPGIDDGAQTIEDSVSLVKGLVELGYQKIITTPHVYSEHYPNTKETILRGAENLRIALKEAGIHVPVEAAAEYFMDDDYERTLKQNEIIPIRNKYVLVEMSFFGEPPNLDNYLFRTQTKGFQPILAHPERYLFYKGNLESYEALKEKGCLFQVNILSLTGYYGLNVAQTAQKLLKKGWVDFLGTDMHHANHLQLLKEMELNGDVLKLIEKQMPFKNLEFLR
jgi:protein-tyrosine phosphatase